MQCKGSTGLSTALVDVAPVADTHILLRLKMQHLALACGGGSLCRYTVGPFAVGVFDATGGHLLTSFRLPGGGSCVLPALSLDGVLTVHCNIATYGYVKGITRSSLGALPVSKQ